MATGAGPDPDPRVAPSGSCWEYRPQSGRRSRRLTYWPFKRLRPASPPRAPDWSRARPSAAELDAPPAAFLTNLPRGSAASPANRRPARRSVSAWARPGGRPHPMGPFAEASLACRGRGGAGQSAGVGCGRLVGASRSREVRESFFGGPARSSHVPRPQAARRGRRAGGRQGSGPAWGLRGGCQARARRGSTRRREGVPRGGAGEETRLAQGQEAEEDFAEWAQGTGHRLRALPERAARADPHAPPGSALSRDHQDAGRRVEQAAANGEAAVPG
uniref:Uncharacterized protein n=1 Tax=Papio anubis TaxID=9555 RepID=A0A8I5N8X9_PAPAN